MSASAREQLQLLLLYPRCFTAIFKNLFLKIQILSELHLSKTTRTHVLVLHMYMRCAMFIILYLLLKNKPFYIKVL